MTINAVLFDMDCTLTDRRRSIAGAARLFARKYGLPAGVSVERLDEVMWVADRWGYRDRREFFAELIETLKWSTLPPMAELLRFWAEDHPTCCMAQEDAYEVLTRLREAGLKLAIVTNGDLPTQSAKIRQMGMEPYVDAVVISVAIGMWKPDPAIFLHTLKLLHCDAKHALFVGDHPDNDIAGAMGAGLRAAWMPAGLAYPDTMPQQWLTIRRLSDLLDRIPVREMKASMARP